MSSPAESPPATLADAIREGRGERGWSQSQLARKLDVTETTVQNWESGDKYPSHPYYERMCVLFDWPLPYSGKQANPGQLNLPGLGMLPEPSNVDFPLPLEAATA